MDGKLRRGTSIRFLALLLAILTASCATTAPAQALPEQAAAATAPASGGPPGADIERLAAVEVRDYQGARLDSVTDFPEISIRGPQTIDRASYSLHVGGLVDRALDLGYDKLLALPRVEKVVTIRCVEGWNATLLWEGFRIRDLLDRAGWDKTASTLIFWAADGYSTSLPLADVIGRDLIVAVKMNGVELPPERGFPLALVAEEHWGYKWIKWITRIEVSDEADYKGFWESRGYGLHGVIGQPEEPEVAKPSQPMKQ
jgi:DMSO/TMAO reductase YedYZ molybdopterin-dependent catalytic subunit